jgi:CBS domain-containing protein
VPVLRELRVREVMTPNPVTLPPSASVAEAVRVMAEKDIGSVLVVDDEGRLVGIVSERDIIRRVLGAGRGLEDTRLEEIMTRDPVSVDPEATIDEALRVMARLRVRHLPVVDQSTGRLVGMVSIRDIEEAII